MSNLSNRTISKPISKPNATRAVRRIRKELAVMIDKSPAANEFSRPHAVKALNAVVREVGILYDINPREL